jgi:hypothetical protein
MNIKWLEAPIHRGASKIFFEVGWEDNPPCFYIILYRIVFAIIFKDNKPARPLLKLVK